MKYSFKCPECGHMVVVDAKDDNEAVEKINKEGKTHITTVHPNMPAMPAEQMTELVRTTMKMGG